MPTLTGEPKTRAHDFPLWRSDIVNGLGSSNVPIRHGVLVEQSPCRTATLVSIHAVPKDTFLLFLLGFEEQGTVMFQPALVRHGAVELSGYRICPATVLLSDIYFEVYVWRPSSIYGVRRHVRRSLSGTSVSPRANGVSLTPKWAVQHMLFGYLVDRDIVFSCGGGVGCLSCVNAEIQIVTQMTDTKRHTLQASTRYPKAPHLSSCTPRPKTDFVFLHSQRR